MNRRATLVNWLGQTARRSVIVGGIFAAVFGTEAYAGPDAPIVVNGNVVFNQNGNWYTINASDGAIINYSAFDIAAWETVQFIQPGEWARVLNRITGPDPSSIDGKLLANGQVYFVNPAGIMFGPNSVINVGGIYAAAGSITNQDFLGGINRFVNLSGGVMNQGAISADSVHLIGQFVSNQGTISANGGVLTMLAGNDVVFQEQGDSIAVYVDGHKLTDNMTPSHGGTSPSMTTTPGVENSGVINVAHGRAVLGAGDLYSLAVNNVGVINAESGNVALTATDGLVRNAGVIDTSSIAGHGGTITMQGPSVVNQGSLLANSQNGQAGSIEVTSQHHTYLLDDSVISAAGTGANSHGGNVLVHSYEGLTVFDKASSIDISSGSGGHGGFAEVSGHHLLFRGFVKLNGANAISNGTLLIDPLDLYVVNGDDINTQAGDLLFTGQNGNIQFNDPDSTTDLYISAQILESFIGAIILRTTRDLFVQYRVNLQNNNAVTLEAGRHLFLNAPILNAAALTLTAGLNFDGNYPAGNVTVDFGADFNYLHVNGQLMITGDELVIAENLFADGITLTATGGADPAIQFTGGNVQTINAGANPLDITGIARKTNAGMLWFAGGAVALNDDVSAMDDIRVSAFSGLTAQDLSADNGKLRLNIFSSLDAGNLTAGENVEVAYSGPGFGEIDNVSAGQDALFLVGDIRADGDVVAARDVLFLNQSRISGNVTAGRNATFRGNAEFDGAADQTVAANDGIADFDANVTKTTAGSLGITGVNGIQLGGDANTLGDLMLTTTTGGVDVNGTGDQTIASSAGTVTVSDGTNVTKSTDGALAINGATGIALGGDASTSNGDLNLNGDVDLDGTGDQMLTAVGGMLTADGNVDKTTAGNVSIDGESGIAIAGDMSTTAGDLSFASANGSLDFNGVVDQMVDVNGGSIRIADGLDAEKTGTGSLTLDGENGIEVGGDLSSNDNLTLASGSGIVDFNGTNGDQIASSVSGSVVIDSSDVTKSTDGALTLDGEAGVSLNGNIATSNGDLTLASANGMIDFNGGSDQSATAVGGSVIATTDVNKSGAGALTVDGESGIQLSGNIATSAGDLNLTSTNGDVDFNGIGDQMAEANGGALNVTGDTDVTKSTAGNLTLDGEAGVALSGDISTTAGDLNLASDSGMIDFNGTGDQVAMAAGGSVIAAVSMLKSSAGAMAVNGENGVQLGGDISTTDGDLVLNSSGGMIDFNGTGDQNATAGNGILDLNAIVVKSTDGALTLSGLSGVFANSDVSVTNGDLTFVDFTTFDGVGDQMASAEGQLIFEAAVTKTGGSLDLAGASGIMVAGNAMSDGDLVFQNDVVFNGTADQAVSAAGELRFSGDAERTGGNLTLTGDSGIFAAGDVTGDMSLNFMSKTTFNGTGTQMASAGSELKFAETVEKTGTGDLELAGIDGITLSGDAVSDAGLAFLNDVNFNGTDQTVEAADVLALSGNVTADDDLTLTAADGIDFDGGDQSAGAAGELRFESVVAKSTDGSLTLGMSGGTLVLASDASTTNGDLVLDTNTELVATGLQTLTADGGTIVANGNIDKGEGDLTLAGATELSGSGDQEITVTEGTLKAEGMIEKTTAGALSLEAGQLIDLTGGAMAMGNLSLNTTNVGTETPGVPLLATIVGRGDLTLASSGGDVLIGGDVVNADGTIDEGQTFEKITAFNEDGSDADVTISAAGTASFSDITATGSIFVDAATIQIRLRPDARLDRFDGDNRVEVDGFGRPYSDFGTDFVARNGITFTGTIDMVGDGIGIRNPSFATVDSGGVSANIFEQGFLVRALGTEADLVRVSDGDLVYDLRAFGPTNTDVSNAIAGAAPRQSESDDVGQGIGLNPGDLARLRTLGIYARNLSDDEIFDTLAGRGVYDDYDGLQVSMRDSGRIGNEPIRNDYVVAAPRIPYDLIQRVFTKYEQNISANRDEIKTSITEAWTAFADEVETEAMATDAQGDAFCNFCEARPEFADAAMYIADLRDLFQSIEILGLNEAELDGSHEMLASYVRPSRMERDVFQAAVKSGMEAQGTF